MQHLRHVQSCNCFSNLNLLLFCRSFSSLIPPSSLLKIPTNLICQASAFCPRALVRYQTWCDLELTLILSCLRPSSQVRAGGLFTANFAFSRKTRRNASSNGLSKEIIVVVFLFLSIHLYLLHFCSEDSYQTDIKIDDESIKAEVIDTAGNVSRASCYSMTVFPTLSWSLAC